MSSGLIYSRRRRGIEGTKLRLFSSLSPARQWRGTARPFPELGTTGNELRKARRISASSLLVLFVVSAAGGKVTTRAHWAFLQSHVVCILGTTVFVCKQRSRQRSRDERSDKIDRLSCIQRLSTSGSLSVMLAFVSDVLFYNLKTSDVDQ